jgi:dihydrofolate reductase
MFSIMPKRTAGGVKMIAAVSSNNIIGHNGQLPWNLPKDRLWFETCIQGGVILTGRRSYEETGSALPGAYRTVVVSKANASYTDALCVPTFNGKE